MRGSGWATDWPKAVRGLHELAHAAAGPLRKGGGLNFLPVQEDQEIERNAAIKCGQNRDGRRDCRGLVAPSASRCAVPLRLAALACVGQRSEKHTPIGVRWREDLGMRERQEITFRAHKREHIRVASRELPWVGDGLGPQPYHLCHMAFVICGTIRPLGLLDSRVPWPRSSGLCCGGERSEPERHSPEERARLLAGLSMSRQTLSSHRHDQ